jgi:RHS repeat-associated protein
VWGDRFPEPVALIDYTELGNAPLGTPEVLHYVQDALGSVAGLTDAGDPTANPPVPAKQVERYVYDPYGRTYVETWDASLNGGAGGWTRPATSFYGNPFGWTGQRYDPGVGLYHFYARTYSPELGRWLQRDPLGFVDGVNTYEYVRSMPTRLTDPLGLFPPQGGPGEGFDPPPPTNEGPKPGGGCGGGAGQGGGVISDPRGAFGTFDPGQPPGPSNQPPRGPFPPNLPVPPGFPPWFWEWWLNSLLTPPASGTNNANGDRGRWIQSSLGHGSIVYEHDGKYYKLEMGLKINFWEDVWRAPKSAFQLGANLVGAVSVGGVGQVSKQEVARPDGPPTFPTAAQEDAALHAKFDHGDGVYYNLWWYNCNHFVMSNQTEGTGH